MSRHATPTRSHRRATSNSPETGSTRLVCAADIIARHRLAAAGADRSAGPAGTTVRVPTAFAFPVPIRVIKRPVLVAAAVLATVAAVGASYVTTSTASSHQAAPTTSASAAPATSAPTSAAAMSSAAMSSAATSMPAARSTATATHRISRAKRGNTVPKALTKPGQTVAGVWVKPNTGPMTSCFCQRWGSMHGGIDLAGPLGSPILAVGDGVVLEAGAADGFGNWVVIRHANGDASIYGHMQYFFVHAGEKVKAGQKIALVGSEGQSTGPHLHFELHQGGLDGAKIDPVPWLKARGISAGPYSPDA